MSLRTELNLWIQRDGYVSYQQILDYCNAEHYKIETASRKLRPSFSPNVEAVFRNGAITGWRWKTYNIPLADEKPRKSPNLNEFGVNIGGLTLEAARQAVERHKQLTFLQGH